MQGREAVVEYLLHKGANPVPFEVAAQYHQQTYFDWTKEPRAHGYDSLIRKIEAAIETRYGPPVDEGNIRQAVLDGDLERVRRLIAERPERARQIDSVANTPLHIAVATNNVAMTRLLIESGAPIDTRNGSGRQ